jgi:hypothetical protein
VRCVRADPDAFFLRSLHQNQEFVVLEDGYLTCPWLNGGINNVSVAFIAELYSSLRVQIYEPGDGVYYSPEHLAKIDRDFLR